MNDPTPISDYIADFTIEEPRCPYHRLGRWMSAALSDPEVRPQMRADIEAWFAAGGDQPPTVKLLGFRDWLRKKVNLMHSDYVRVANEPYAKGIEEKDLEGWRVRAGEALARYHSFRIVQDRLHSEFAHDTH